MTKKRMWYRRLAILWAAICMLGIFTPEQIQAAAVADRVKAVTRTYPNGSYYNGYMVVSYIKDGVQRSYIGHECAGFVMYVTKQAFQQAYYNGSPDYKKIYKTVSTKNTEEMKTLFSQAKIGDVIRWTGSGGRHQAIFLSDNRVGIQVYEANFGNQYNRVWYNHLWPWNNTVLWTNTSSSVSVYRYKNYAKVDGKVKSVTLNKSKLSLKRGKNQKLTAQVSPESAYKKTLAWTSSNPRVAKVTKRGVVKALAKGRAVITVKAQDGSGRKAFCNVTVR